MIRQYSKVQTAAGLLAAQRFGQLPLGRAGTVAGDDRQHRVDHALGGDAQLLQLPGLFTARSRSSANSASTISLSGNALRNDVPGIDRQERQLGTDARAVFDAGPADIVDRLLHGVERARRVGLHLRHPERLVLLLKALHAMAEIGRLLAARPWDRPGPADSGSIPSHPCSRRRRRDGRRADIAHCASRSRPGHRCRPRSISRSSRSASNGILGATPGRVTTSSMAEAPC